MTEVYRRLLTRDPPTKPYQAYVLDNWVDRAGDTMTGDLVIKKDLPKLQLDSSGQTYNPQISFLHTDGSESLISAEGTAGAGNKMLRVYQPFAGTDDPDAVVDLGLSSFRFRNLYLWKDVIIDGKVDGVDVDVHRHDGTEGHGVAIGGDTMTTPGKETSTTSTSYVTPSGFVFFFDPSIYNASALTGVFTARIRTTDAAYTAYARLQNVTDSVTLAEVSTTSTSYTILQSAEFSLPTDAVKRFDVQLKTDGATVYCEGVTLHVRRG